MYPPSDELEDPPLAPEPAKRWLMTIAKIAVVAVLAWFVRATLLKAWDEIRRQPWEVEYAWLALATALYVVSLLPAGWFFWITLKRLKQPVGWLSAFRAYCVGHLGKYVPGKAMVVVLRAGMIGGRGVSIPLAAAAVFYETLTMMAVGACWATLVLGARWWTGALDLGEAIPSGALAVGVVGMIVASLVPTLPPVFQRLLTVFRVLPQAESLGQNAANGVQPAAALCADSGSSHKRHEQDSQCSNEGDAAAIALGQSHCGDTNNRRPSQGVAIDLRLAAMGWAAMLPAWLLMGASLWATVRGLSPQAAHWTTHWADYSAVSALALVAGFLSMIPAGFGVRDLLLVVLCARLFGIGEGVAAAAAAVIRIEWLLAELVLSGILIWRRETNTPEPR